MISDLSFNTGSLFPLCDLVISRNRKIANYFLLLYLHPGPIFQIRWSIDDHVFSAGKSIDHVAIAALAENFHFACDRAAVEGNHHNPLAAAIAHRTRWHDRARRNRLRLLLP